MKCPKCVEEGEKSQVYPGLTSVTCMGYQPYYDEEGKFHRHDPNWHSSSFRCSRGHEWTRSWKAGCGACDYGKDEDQITMEAEE